MLAIVEADMSTRRSAPRFRRSGASAALVSENGTAASLMLSPGVFAHPVPLRPWQALSGGPEPNLTGQARASGLASGRAGQRAVAQHDLARHRHHPGAARG